MSIHFLLADVIVDDEPMAVQGRYIRIEHITDVGPGADKGTAEINFIGGTGVVVRGTRTDVMRSIARILGEADSDAK